MSVRLEKRPSCACVASFEEKPCGGDVRLVFEPSARSAWLLGSSNCLSKAGPVDVFRPAEQMSCQQEGGHGLERDPGVVVQDDVHASIHGPCFLDDREVADGHVSKVWLAPLRCPHPRLHHRATLG